MSAGYSGTPLIKKLGIKAGFAISVVDQPDNYWELLGPLPQLVTVKDLDSTSLNFVHLFVTSKSDLQQELSRAKERVRPEGMTWVSWPKRSSHILTDLSENVVREVALESGLVDVKVCAVDETWSGLKLVRRLKDRG